MTHHMFKLVQSETNYQSFHINMHKQKTAEINKIQYLENARPVLSQLVSIFPVVDGSKSCMCHRIYYICVIENGSHVHILWGSTLYICVIEYGPPYRKWTPGCVVDIIYS